MRNWKEICAKCADGEIEPECEYYGEPNGCNSPTYQEHPHPDNAAARDEVVLRLSKEEYKGMQEALSEHDRLCEMLTESRMSIGNAAAMREAINKALAFLETDFETGDGRLHFGDIVRIGNAKSVLKAALSAPARNCDNHDTKHEAKRAWFLEEVQPRLDGKRMDHEEIPLFDWLFEKAKKDDVSALALVSTRLVSGHGWRFHSQDEKRTGRLRGERGGEMSPDEELHWSWNGLKKVLWRDTRYEGVQWYYAEERLYVLRVRAGQPNEHYLLIKERSPEDAIRRAIYNMQTADEINGTKGERRFPAAWCCRDNEKGKTMQEYKEYIRCHVVKATPMTHGCYNSYRGLEMPAKENADDEGYHVVYPDGYESWCPKVQFEAAGRPIDGMTFGQAIEAMKQGKKVARKGWNGKGMWLCVPLCNGPKEIPASAIWGKPNAEYAEQNGGTVKVVPYVTMKAADGTIVMGWLASQTDMLSEDWCIVE